VDRLLAFHEEGGALLLAVDPWLEDPAVDRLLEGLHLLRERAVATAPSPMYQDSRRAVLALRSFEPTHPISAPIARQGVLAVMAPCGALARHPGTPATVRTTALAKTAPDVFGDLPAGPGEPGNWTLDPDELQAPRAVGFALEGQGGRAVVFGGGGFLTNSYLDATKGGPGNMDLGLNAANWLVQRDYALGIRPREVYESKVELFPGELGDVFLYVVVLMPLGGILLGVLVWFVRRR
jgi:hypothetical protein